MVTQTWSERRATRVVMRRNHANERDGRCLARCGEERLREVPTTAAPAGWQCAKGLAGGDFRSSEVPQFPVCGSPFSVLLFGFAEHRERRTANCEPRTGNWEPGTGNREPRAVCSSPTTWASDAELPHAELQRRALHPEAGGRAVGSGDAPSSLRSSAAMMWRRSASSSVSAPAHGSPPAELARRRAPPRARRASCPARGSPRARSGSAARGCCRASRSASSASIVSVGIVSIVFFIRRANCCAKCRTSIGMSSRRSRSGGTCIGKTLSR